MTQTAPKIEWYIARDGQQFGPVTEEELARLVVKGQLLPSDLVWRQGFGEWRAAVELFTFPPSLSRPAPPPAAAQRPGRESYRTEPARAEPYRQSAAAPRSSAPAGAAVPRRSFDLGFAKNALAIIGATAGAVTHRAAAFRLSRLLTATMVVLALIGSGWYTLRSFDVIGRLLSLAPGGFGTADASPFKSSGDSLESIDSAFQRVALWRRLKQDFPDWYDARVQDVHRLKSERRDDMAIAKHLAEAVAAQRRKHITTALSASADRLKGLAQSFLNNLETLSQHSIEACYGFISQGEQSPAVLPLILNPRAMGGLHRQLSAVFEAIAEGQKSPQKHPQASRADYDLLLQELKTRGWSAADLKLFSDPQALGRAPPEQVCKLVKEWFAANVALTDREAETRLLILSHRPVVGG